MSQGELNPSASVSRPDAPKDSKLHGILRARLTRRGVETVTSSQPVYWNADYFGLSRVDAFCEASQAKQRAILSDLTRDLLCEALWIEKIGMGYGSKMALRAETSTEQALYCHIAADEAAHFGLLQKLAPHVLSDTTEHPFLDLLAQIVDQGDPQAMVFLVQVVLEGWGLTHYRNLAEACQHTKLADGLADIVRDEASHHGSGVVITSERPPNRASKETIVSALVQFLQMVQVGPQMVVGALDRHLGLAKQSRQKVFAQLDCQVASTGKLELLKRLVAKAGAPDLEARLDSYGLFVGFDAATCAAM